MESYKIEFKGKKFKSGEYKNKLYNFINNSVTHKFEFDGEKLELTGGEDDIEKISGFVRGDNIQIVITKN